MLSRSDVLAPALRLASSETAELFRSTDWSRTPLGPVEGWPQSLRTAVSICLNSRFPMFVWWGPQLINIYNDAYTPILGKRHPQAFGQSAPTIWAEIWPVVGPQAEAVMKRGEASWNERVLLVMERHGYVENTYFTWSYSPIPDDAGAIGGVFCACTEETSDVLADNERDRRLDEMQLERTLLAEAFAQSPAFLAIMSGPKHVFESVNNRYCDLIGGRDVVGKPLHEALPEVEEQGFIKILDRVYATGEPFFGSAMRLILRQPDGALQDAYVDFVYQPMRSSDGTIVGVLVQGVDVTEQKRAEARDRFLLVLDDAVRPLTDPAQITATCARLLGEHIQADRCAYAEVEADQDMFNLVGDYTRDVPTMVGRYLISDFGEEARRLLREGKPFVVTDIDRLQPPPGELAAYRQAMIQTMIAVPLHKAGRLAAGMAVHQKTPRTWRSEDVELVQHVASRCWESIERARVERTLRKSEAQFRQLADAMPQIVFAARPDGDVDYFNRQWYEYTGLPDGEVGFDSWKQVHTEEGLRRVMEMWPDALRTGRPYEIEYALRRHDGVYRWHLGRALPIRDERGEIVRWYGTNTDIHDRKQFEQSLQEARLEAERANRMKDEFLATLSHELRTPLNAILGWAQILSRKSNLPGDLAQGVAIIERNARAQGRIVEDLLDMSAIISGKVRLDVQPLDLFDAVHSAVETTRPMASAKQISIAAKLDLASGITVSADAHRLQQIFWNLLSNAIKFTSREGRIEVSVRPIDSRVEISISDTGEGIAPDFLPFLFDRFRQADASPTRRYGGLGLGLSIVRQLVEVHGGSVRATSAGPGKGATFTVMLPITEMQRAAGPLVERRRARALSAGAGVPEHCNDLAGLRVLVVDDDIDARNLVRQLLQDCSATVTTAASTEEALKCLQRERFDVLVSDIGMPGQDGHTLIRSVRLLGAAGGGDIPAVALTAYARPEDRVKAIRAGFQMHLAKPIDPAELVTMVASLGKRI